MTELDADTLARLERGDVLPSHAVVGGQDRVQALGIIEASPAAVWEVITDYANYKHFMPHTKESEVVERKGSSVLFRTVLEFPIRDVWYIIRLTLDAKRRRVDWHMEEGNLKANDGSWALEARGRGRTLATYTVAIDPGFYVPKILLRKATEGTLPMLINAVRARVKAGG